MSSPRFFVDAALHAGASVDLPDRVAHHASHVLRLRDGAPVVVFDGRGGEYKGQLTARGTCVELHAHDPVERESPLSIALVQAWIATDRLEWVVEKAVELGVTRVLLAPAARSVIRLDGDRLSRRVDRLREIVIAACCQCGRNRLPRLEACANLDGALASAAANALAVVLDPGAEVPLPALAGPGQSAFAIAVGPEGGFDDAEVRAARDRGYQSARLGRRVLRTETAGIAALATLQATHGDYR